MAVNLPKVRQFLIKYLKYTHNCTVSTSYRQLRCFQTNHMLGVDATKVFMPALSPTMQDGTIVKWYKKEGDTINAGDQLCDIQTDKAVVSLDTEEEGILAKILKPDNTQNITLGTLIALIVPEGEDWQNVEIPADTESAQPEASSGQAVSATPAAQVTQSHHGYGPAVRSIMDMYNLNLEKITGTGPHGRILKGDLLKYIKANNLSPDAPKMTPLPASKAPVLEVPAKSQAPTQGAPVSKPSMPPPPPQPAPQLADSVDLELSNMRKVIAKRLTESKTTIPHAYATISCEIDELTKLRKNLISDGIKVSVNDFIIKSVAVALQKVPEANAIWAGDSGRVVQNIDISVAVATDNGLITPIVKDAIGLGVQEISEQVKALAERARLGKLQPEEFIGGTFTISNLGMFGISEFSAVINPPQACILAIGGSQSVLVEEDGRPTPKTYMTVTLSSDARMVDEFLATRFLEAFRDCMENPMLMLSQAPQVSLASLFAK